MYLTFIIIGLTAFGAVLLSTAANAKVSRGREASEAGLGRWTRLAYGAMLVGIAGTAITSLIALVGWGGPMSNWLLMIHCTAAPLFAIGIAAVALTMAQRSAFSAVNSSFSRYQKTLFWVMLGLGVVVLLSAVSPMMPWSGTDGQHTLYLTHRYSSLALLAATVLHALSLARPK